MPDEGKDRGSGGDGDDYFLHRLDEVWEGVRGSGGHSQLFLCTQEEIIRVPVIAASASILAIFLQFLPTL